MQNLEEQARSQAPINPDSSTPGCKIRSFNEIIIDKSPSETEKIIARYNYKVLWTYAANCILALWLITNPHLYDYKSVPLSTSDTISGALIILFEVLSFSPRRAWLRWCTPAVALWLLLAPLMFWSPSPATYLMDTLIACAVIVFSILVPGVPGRGGIELAGPDQPPGWTYNPSSWIRRWLGIVLALIGFFISRYLAAHQLGYIPHAWDPIFAGGSDKVLTSVVSRSFPISDAGFGGVAYILEALMGFMGDRARWRSAPWIVIMFLLLVLPLGITSIILVTMQPIIVGAWCGLCLIAAAGLLTSVPLAVHEAVAVGQFLLEAKSQKKDLWQIFWLGGTITGAGAEDPDRMSYSFSQRWIASVQGVTVPWSIFAQLAIGIWIMAQPHLLSFGGKIADYDYLLGAFVVTVAAVATAEVTRTVRFVNILLGLLLIVCASLFARPLPTVFYSELISGALLCIASLPRGAIIERYGNWDKYVK
jgi:Vitamin K epoxide reductase family